MGSLEVEPRPVKTPPEPRGRSYGSVVVGAILVVVGGLWFFDAIDVVEVQAAVVLPAVLAVVGIALMFGALDGPHSGLIVFGIFLTVAVVFSAVVPTDAFRGGVGERQYRVQGQDSLLTDYQVGVGDLELDLRDLDLTESATVDVTVGAGKIVVLLPADVPVSIDASSGAGKVDLLGEVSEGLSVSRTYESPGFGEETVGLTLDLDVAAGEIEVK